MKKAEDKHDNKVIGVELTDEQLMNITGGFVQLLQSDTPSGIVNNAVRLAGIPYAVSAVSGNVQTKGIVALYGVLPLNKQ